MKRGLVVGKFYPLHRGHQFLIESALAAVDDLTVVVYRSEPSGWETNWETHKYMPVGAEQRAGWIAALYPQVENILVREDIFSAEVLQEVKDHPAAAEAYAKDLAFLGKFDYVFSSEAYGDEFARQLGAEHICIDQAREMMPVSGTMLRENAYQYRAYVDPLVYRDLVQKVVFVGTESTGKSSLAEAMAKEMDTRWVHEYGRELWESQGLTGTFHDQLKIMKAQYQREEAAVQHANRWLFCDTNAFTTMQWWEMFDGSVDIRLHDFVQRTKDEYLWILCENDFDWVQDGTRELEGQKSHDFQEQNRRHLEELCVSYPTYTVRGSLTDRVEQVKLCMWDHLSR